MDVKRSGLLAIGIALALSGAAAGQTGGSGGGYSYIREATGDVHVESRYNGTVTAGRNMPISVGDEIVLADSGKAEVSLADGRASISAAGRGRSSVRSATSRARTTRSRWFASRRARSSSRRRDPTTAASLASTRTTRPCT